MMGQKPLVGKGVEMLVRGLVVSGTGRRVRGADICMLSGAYFLLVWVNPRGKGRRTVVSELRVAVDAHRTANVGCPWRLYAA